MSHYLTVDDLNEYELPAGPIATLFFLPTSLSSTSSSLPPALLPLHRSLHPQPLPPLFPPAHVDAAPPLFGPNTYQAISIGLLILLVVGVLAVVGGMAFVKNQKKSKKRFF